MSLHDTIDKSKLPEHVAVIMDGNGRWAKQKGALRIFGHQNAVKSVRDVIESAAELGIKYLTLYAFSTENWSRPKDEVNALMELLVSTLRSEINELHKNNIRLTTIGNITDLPEVCQQQLGESKEITSQNTGLTLIIALSYSGRWEIVEAVKKIAEDTKAGKLSPESIDEQTVSSYLSTHNIPDPELLIRTSGEKRISNFLLWQIAYSELYITDVLWPDFRKDHFYEAIHDYQKRERRFGKTSEQIDSSGK
ncbi:MAG TPA: isoprenyl transferase [Cytophagaceae bacterium]|jgi:undecaprenyl diphosphate synthase|nr:isoprenyl transferase [Cytophagaceae bacterium]